MARRLFYVDTLARGRAELAGEAAQHLRKVLRAERGFQYEISDNESLWLAEIEDFRRDAVTFKLLERLPLPPRAAEVHLYPALIKFDAFEWMLEKTTELGVASITPVYPLRTDKGLDQAAMKRMERWRRIILEAGQQSRRVPRPVLNPLCQLGEALAQPAAQRLFCDEQSGAAPVLSILTKGAEPIAAIIGPEGGWDERERAAALSAGWQAVSLGPHILRAETAACAVLAVLTAAACQR